MLRWGTLPNRRNGAESTLFGLGRKGARLLLAMLRHILIIGVLSTPASPLLAQATLGPAEETALAALGADHAINFELIDSWFENRPIQYYDFGPSPVDAGTLYRVRGGGEVFSTIPGTDRYTTLRQILDVEVTNGSIAAESLRSQAVILALVARGHARLTPTGTILNVPIVPAGSTLDRDPESRPLKSAWYAGREVFYFDFGPNRPAITPLIAFGKVGEDGEVQIVQGTNVLRIPGVPGYTDIWGVTLVLGGSYEPNVTYRDYRKTLADAKAGRFDKVLARPSRNCPVVYIEGKPAPRPLAK